MSGSLLTSFKYPSLGLESIYLLFQYFDIHTVLPIRGQLFEQRCYRQKREVIKACLPDDLRYLAEETGFEQCLEVAVNTGFHSTPFFGVPPTMPPTLIDRWPDRIRKSLRLRRYG